MLKIESLEVRYQQLRALRGVSLVVEEGDLVALIGSNGAGKTTLLNTVSGLVTGSAGRIFWEGSAISGMSPDEICRLGLSGGEQQMVAVARALMACPRLLMLDEPSLGLAPIAAKEIFRIVADLNLDGLTVLLVSQEVLQALSISKNVYLLENGEIALSGPAYRIAADSRVKESYLGL